MPDVSKCDTSIMFLVACQSWQLWHAILACHVFLSCQNDMSDTYDMPFWHVMDFCFDTS
jgi:hypothetical protein